MNRTEPFYAAFSGMIASDNAALVKGYYEYGLEELRQLLRKQFADNNLLLEERYKTIPSHITTIRIPDKLNNPSTFIKYIEKDNEFGKMQVEGLELVFHNWYDSKKTILASMDLHSKL